MHEKLDTELLVVTVEWRNRSTIQRKPSNTNHRVCIFYLFILRTRFHTRVLKLFLERSRESQRLSARLFFTHFALISGSGHGDTAHGTAHSLRNHRPKKSCHRQSPMHHSQAKQATVWCAQCGTGNQREWVTGDHTRQTGKRSERWLNWHQIKVLCSFLSLYLLTLLMFLRLNHSPVFRWFFCVVQTYGM